MTRSAAQEPAGAVDQPVRYEIAGRIARVTINRPEARNAINPAVRRALIEAFADASVNPDVWLVILTGAGDRAFCAGGDLKKNDENERQGKRHVVPMTGPDKNDYETVLECYKPKIAALNGHAFGGGLELALSCDIRVASETARFGAGEIKLGWHGGAGNTQLLPRLVGYGKAMEMVLTGDLIDAAEARADGLVQRLVPDTELEATTEALAERIAANAPIAAVLAKHLVRMSESTAVDVGLRWENDLFAYCFTTADAAEGRAAFTEKRQPVFRGE